MKRMRAGVIGAGLISDIYISNLLGRFAGQIELVSVSSRGMRSAEAKAAKYGIIARSVSETLADPGIELVIVLTPVGSHEGLIRAALEAGKHVYTEKTVTDDPAAARELLRLAEEKGLSLCAAPDTFLGSSLQTARRALDSGMLGEVNSFAISSTRCNDYFLSHYPFLREPGCGVLYDYAVYYMTALVSLLGPVEAVSGFCAVPYPVHIDSNEQSPGFGKPMDTPNESQVSAALRMRSGVLGTLHVDSDNTISDEAYFRIYGTKGTLVLGDPNRFGGEVSFIPAATRKGQKTEPRVLEQVSEFSDNCRGIGPAEMAEALSEGRKPLTDASLACHVLDALNGILEASEDLRVVGIGSSCERPAPFEELRQLR